MKKVLVTATCALLCAVLLCSCVAVEMGGESGEVSETPASSASRAAQTPSSAISGEAHSAAPSKEAAPSEEESRSQPTYAPVYPEGYAERVAYYSNMSVGAGVHDRYFDNFVFVGNSIMLHFKNYVAAKRATVPDFLGSANVLAAASFSFYNNAHQKASDPDCAFPVFRGEKLDIAQAVEKTGAKTLCLSLMALNDIALYKDGMTGVNETFALFKQLIGELKATYPKLDIVIIGNTYLHESANGMKKLNNGTIYALNSLVLDYCNAENLDFIDVAYVLIDDRGCLGTEFCSDVGADVACHLNEASYNAWTEILRDYAAKKTAKNWANPKALKPLNKNE